MISFMLLKLTDALKSHDKLWHELSKIGFIAKLKETGFVLQQWVFLKGEIMYLHRNKDKILLVIFCLFVVLITLSKIRSNYINYINYN